VSLFKEHSHLFELTFVDAPKSSSAPVVSLHGANCGCPDHAGVLDARSGIGIVTEMSDSVRASPVPPPPAFSESEILHICGAGCGKHGSGGGVDARGGIEVTTTVAAAARQFVPLPPPPGVFATVGFGGAPGIEAGVRASGVTPLQTETITFSAAPAEVVFVAQPSSFTTTLGSSVTVTTPSSNSLPTPTPTPTVSPHVGKEEVSVASDRIGGGTRIDSSLNLSSVSSNLSFQQVVSTPVVFSSFELRISSEKQGQVETRQQVERTKLIETEAALQRVSDVVSKLSQILPSGKQIEGEVKSLLYLVKNENIKADMAASSATSEKIMQNASALARSELVAEKVIEKVVNRPVEKISQTTPNQPASERLFVKIVAQQAESLAARTTQAITNFVERSPERVVQAAQSKLIEASSAVRLLTQSVQSVTFNPQQTSSRNEFSPANRALSVKGVDLRPSSAATREPNRATTVSKTQPGGSQQLERRVEMKSSPTATVSPKVTQESGSVSVQKGAQVSPIGPVKPTSSSAVATSAIQRPSSRAEVAPSKMPSTIQSSVTPKEHPVEKERVVTPQRNSLNKITVSQNPIKAREATGLIVQQLVVSKKRRSGVYDEEFEALLAQLTPQQARKLRKLREKVLSSSVDLTQDAAIVALARVVQSVLGTEQEGEGRVTGTSQTEQSAETEQGADTTISYDGAGPTAHLELKTAKV